jgi:NAD(P)-dependent dehydrogenase (short-subunit alcohol dehydrogenase family)
VGNAPPRFDFAQQTAIVTGGASGIGQAIARQLAGAGAYVVIADRDSGAAHAEAEALRRTSGAAAACAVDVSDPDSVDALFAWVASVRGGPTLHVLIHSAGIGIERPLTDTTNEEWNRILSVDLSGAFYCLRAAGRWMAKAGYGRIVALSSTAGVRGGSGRAAYGAAKSGVIMLTRVLAVELAQFGVTVNTLAPGAIETALVARMHSEATRQNYRRSIPMDRYGTPEEVAHAALFLASREATYVTGHVLAVDGGFLAAGVLNK